MNTISINGKTLYFGDSILSEKEKLSFSLPPKPPFGGKDIRFFGDTKLCTAEECLIEVMNNGSPLTIECEIKDSENWQLVPVIANQVQPDEAIYLINETQITLDPNVEQFILRKSTFSEIPSEFSLLIAYPNPFNPVTTIQYSVQMYSNVSIQIYDITGKLVETLVNEKLSQGNHTVQWNAKGFSSGVYLLHLKSGNFSQLEKLMLIK